MDPQEQEGHEHVSGAWRSRGLPQEAEGPGRAPQVSTGWEGTAWTQGLKGPGRTVASDPGCGKGGA